MAQWRREERTLQAKIVYYGPALGGKTANLEALQRMTDAGGEAKPLSTQTTDDRTLFFDLLTIELPDILACKLVMNLFSVPGQVRYDTARQVVLSGADAIVFVADSSVGREEQNRWSIQNLQMNMRSRRLDPARVPVLYQFNKQDMPDAAEADEVANWIRVPEGEGIAAVASEGRGVLETFEAACRAMLERLLAQADEGLLEGLERGDIGAQLEKALAPFKARREWASHSEECPDRLSPRGREAIAAKGEDLLQDSIRTSVRLGEWYSNEAAMRRRSGREAEAYRKLVAFDYGAGSGFDCETISDAHLGAVADALDAGAVSLILQSESGQPRLERVWGRPEDPLLASAWGRRMLRRMCASSRPSTIEDLGLECEDAEAGRHFRALRSMAAVPVGEQGTRLLLVYTAQPDGRFNRRDLRFLTAAAVHLGAALRRAGRIEELEGERDRLEIACDSASEQLSRTRVQTGELRREHAEMLSAIPERSEAMLAEAVNAARLLRDKRIQGRKRAEALGLIIEAIEKLQAEQQQVIDRGARFRERLEGFIRLVAPLEAENPEEEEVLDVG